jgi:hypothetical protein
VSIQFLAVAPHPRAIPGWERHTARLSTRLSTWKSEERATAFFRGRKALLP